MTETPGLPSQKRSAREDVGFFFHDHFPKVGFHRNTLGKAVLGPSAHFSHLARQINKPHTSFAKAKSKTLLH